MTDKAHTWRVIAQYDVTPEDAQRLVEGIAGYEGRRPEQYSADDPPLPDDPRLLLGLHNIRQDEVFVGCFVCESSWTPEVAAMPCPGEPTSYGPTGQPLWDGKPLKVDGQVRDTRIAVAPVGRNDPCPCGSGQKFKRCHGA